MAIRTIAAPCPFGPVSTACGAPGYGVLYGVPNEDTYFPSDPEAMVAGADGNLWFTTAVDGIGRITTSGVVTELPIPSAIGATALVSGGDGNLWFVESAQGGAPGTATIGRMTTSGAVTEFSVDANCLGGGSVAAIAWGSDGNVWISAQTRTGGAICQMTPGGAFRTFSLPTASVSGGQLSFGAGTIASIPNQIVAGALGDLWFSAQTSAVTPPIAWVGRIDVQGEITAFAFPSDAAGSVDWAGALTKGADGNMWIATTLTPFQIAVAKVTPTGTVTVYPVADAAPPPPVPVNPAVLAIALGPDGNIWLQPLNGSLCWITPEGSISTEASLLENVGVNGLVTGPDGALWFTQPSVGATFQTIAVDRIMRLQLNEACH